MSVHWFSFDLRCEAAIFFADPCGKRFPQRFPYLPLW